MCWSHYRVTAGVLDNDQGVVWCYKCAAWHCLDWVRGLGETFTINQSWAGHRAQQQWPLSVPSRTEEYESVSISRLTSVSRLTLQKWMNRGNLYRPVISGPISKLAFPECVWVIPYLLITLNLSNSLWINVTRKRLEMVTQDENEVKSRAQLSFQKNFWVNIDAW